jgi:predicted dehydrogenase
MIALQRPVRLGFIGAGWWATTNHLPVLKQRDDVEFVAICRRHQADLQKVQEAYGFALAMTDYRELLTQSLDGVVISTPHECHYEQTKAALEAGLHVMVEKPITLRADHAWELVHLAQARNLHLMVPHGWHYKPFVIEARRLLAAGAVGKIEHILCHMASPTRELFSGAEFRLENLGGMMFPPDLSIYSQRARGGGYGYGQLTHSIGMLLWLTGLRPAEVFAYMSNAGAREVDMHDAISVRFREGAIGTCSGSAGVPAGMAFQVDIRIYGAEGMLLLDVERERMALHRHDQQDVVLPIEPGAGAYSCEGPPIRFVELLQGKDVENLSPGGIAAEVTSLIEAAYTSAETRTPQSVVVYDEDMRPV